VHDWCRPGKGTNRSSLKNAKSRRISRNLRVSSISLEIKNINSAFYYARIALKLPLRMESMVMNPMVQKAAPSSN
jgi:hypothetical protein